MGLIKKAGFPLIASIAQNVTAGQELATKLILPEKLIRRLVLSIKGELDISVGAATSIHADAAARALRNIVLELDGEPVKSGTGPMLFRFHQYIDSTLGVNDGLTSTAVATYPFHVQIPLLFENPASIRPRDSWLDGRDHANVVLKLTWGDGDDLGTAGAATLALQNSTCEVYADTLEPIALEAPLMLWKQHTETFPAVPTSAEFTMQHTYSRGTLLPYVLFQAYDTNQDPQDTIITKLTARINGEEDKPLFNVDADVIRAEAMREFGVTHKPTGYYLVSFVEEGRLLTAIGGNAPRDINDFEFVGNVVGGNTATIKTLVSTVIPAVAA